MKVVVSLLLSFSILLSNPKLETISLQLPWLHQFQSAGFYVAKEKGFYEEVGLHVEIKEYQNGINITEDVLSQKSTYGVGKSSLVIDRANHRDVVALMALFQSSPSILITTNPHIKTLSDLKNKKIMITGSEINSVAITAMLLSNGLSPQDIILQQHSFNIQDLIAQKTDAMASYISNEPFLLDKHHIAHTIFNPKNYGFDFYGDILFTSEDEIKQHEQRVRNFYSATKKGWKWAFENIKESAKLIQEKYNSQHKSLDALMYEGYTLKKLAFTNDKEFGIIEEKKFEDIANIYKLSGLLKGGYCIEGFVDPLKLSKKIVKIGVLANRGDKFALKIWEETANFLSQMIATTNFMIVPLDFNELDDSARKKEVDFVATNPMHYIQLEQRYGISRIATLGTRYKDKFYTKYGSVIFTRADNMNIQKIPDVEGKSVGAVDPHSFGGFILALRELKNNHVEQKDFKKMTFLGTHDNVVKAVLNKTVEVGIIRTIILEKMEEEGTLNIRDIKVLGRKEFNDFPLLSSTELYPEWAFAKLPHTTERLANDVLSVLIKTSSDASMLHELNWKTPLDYSKIHTVLKELKLYPYEDDDFTFEDVLIKYRYLFLMIFVTFLLGVLAITYIKKLNSQLLIRTQEIETFNNTLEHEVEQRTKELKLLSEKLRELANTDELTKIDNRRHFFQLATQYFYTAKRNKTEIYILSLDIDFFKRINDTFGHDAGDEILKLFAKNIKEMMRESDLFGRIGGEEFCVCLQNTNLEGATILAEKIRARIEHVFYKHSSKDLLHVTVSIGMSGICAADTEIFDIVKRADKALYIAKNNGRNQIQIVI